MCRGFLTGEIGLSVHQSPTAADAVIFIAKSRCSSSSSKVGVVVTIARSDDERLIGRVPFPQTGKVALLDVIEDNNQAASRHYYFLSQDCC